MEIGRLRRSHVKWNIVIVLIAIFIISAIVLNFTSARYRVTDTVPLINGRVNYTPYDFKIMAMYQESDTGEYVEIESMPTSGYVINEEESYCTLDNINYDAEARLYTLSTGEHVFSGLKKNSKCYVYFDVDNTMTVQELIASKNIDSSRSGAITGVLTTNTTGTVYSIEDDWGTSYVYAGAPTDNWVLFAGFYWRIIRINGDGSIRMIYAGTDPEVTTGTGTQIQTSAYNSSYNDNAYVGYMYGSTGESNYANTHRNTNDSTIKGILDEWYEENIVKQNLTSYISTEAGFCNDRRIATSSETWWSSDTKEGYGTNVTAYAPWGRFLTISGGWDSTQIPSLKCSQIANDMFTVSGSSKGNHKLTYPVGLITADEIVLAGGFGGSNNTSYYLYTGQYYWTMTPRHFNESDASVFYVTLNGNLYNGSVYWTKPGVRPVINLCANVTLTGSGTSTDPYVVEGEM